MIIQDYSKGNKRIAKNTLVVYGQLMLRMFLGLYTSRLALEALGVSDYGLNSVVGGVVVLFTFISASLAGTTIRFINVERGKKFGNLNRVFNVCHVLHVGMALLLFALLEIGGVFYIHHYLNVDPGKEADAMFVFQIATIACCMGILNIPFGSLFNASEKFLFTATVFIVAKIIQLCLLFWLLTYDGNRVRAFALIETLTELAPFLIYHIYSYSKWPEIVKWHFVKEWQQYKEMLVFSSYNLISGLAGMTRGEGSMLLINYFFGTVVNGAYAIAKAIERVIGPFASNFHSAAAPQITQSYSSGDVERVYFLASRVGKYCMLMMALAFFPLWAELDFILHLWLIKVPEGALVFCRMMMLMVFWAITDGSLNHVAEASGKISRFKMAFTIITLSCIPIGYGILKIGSPAYMLLVVFLIADIIWRIAQLYMMKTILNFPVWRYCKDVYWNVILVCLPVVLCLILTSRIQSNSSLWHLVHLVGILTFTLVSSYFFGLKAEERKTIREFVKKYLNNTHFYHAE
ncbi:Membrane protein involved in the export of O-antigen and teichoic acid [Prevotella sp. khp7]|uniref:lipopolysaccharide biosynthesis protein n=1 Tax=Prevotella sp. khp7 TaxID=1761885 RepID=UPI0008BFF060|nr:hypothetical protein [Prevotella sp. khp7]SEW16300.1 Membrane protein involved in the export of O-antigen and teichoic acid [Prevotella sp. khp7]